MIAQVNPLTGELLLGAERTFSFDYTFGPNCHQEEVGPVLLLFGRKQDFCQNLLKFL